MEILTPYANYALVILCIALAGIIAFLILKLSQLEKKISQIPHLKLSDSLQTDINTHTKILDQNQAHIEKNADAINQIIQQIKQINAESYKSLVTRYNPFKESNVGGNQSFTAVFANSKGNGLLITSLYSRELNRVSSKELIHWNNTEYTISPEELVAIKELRSQFKS